jgi:hypothetical protein
MKMNPKLVSVAEFAAFFLLFVGAVLFYVYYSGLTAVDSVLFVIITVTTIGKRQPLLSKCSFSCVALRCRVRECWYPDSGFKAVHILLYDIWDLIRVHIREECRAFRWAVNQELHPTVHQTSK